jgi:hypothetical protein
MRENGLCVGGRLPSKHEASAQVSSVSRIAHRYGTDPPFIWHRPDAVPPDGVSVSLQHPDITSPARKRIEHHLVTGFQRTVNAGPQKRVLSDRA